MVISTGNAIDEILLRLFGEHFFRQLCYSEIEI
jgi:hypothetical protein